MTFCNDSDWIEIPDWSIGLFEWFMEQNIFSLLSIK